METGVCYRVNDNVGCHTSFNKLIQPILMGSQNFCNPCISHLILCYMAFTPITPHSSFNICNSLLPFIAVLEVAETTSVFQFAHLLPHANDAADRLDRLHQTGRRETDTAGSETTKKGEKELLLRHIPPTIAW